MPRIHILADQLASQIAAGEVVERPASVVKELVENALDAGTTQVRIELEAGGKRRIRVVDDGHGMDADDALLAFDRHATSKISSFEDLQGVATLGFRGEALASIAAVARVELRTARQGGDGHRVQIDGGRIRAAEPIAHPKGTSVEVASLFFNVPARRKFLKTPRTELRQAVQVVQGYALARPEIRFTLVHEERTLLDALPGDPGPVGARGRIGQIFGPSLVEKLAEIDSRAGRPQESIWGFVGDPTTTRGRRYFVFVNRRLLRDRSVMACFYRAVREEWRSDEFPVLFLFLDLPSSEVDVNVHPQKSEVRFRDPALLDRLSNALRYALRSALGAETAPLEPLLEAPRAPFVWQGLGARGAAGGSGPPWVVREGPAPAGDFSAGRLAEAVYAPLERRPVALSGRSGETRPFRLLGQYKATLILLEGPDGLYLVDQHVAHERILYERLRRELEGEATARQAFVEPALLELSPAEALRCSELIPELDACGFSVSELSGNTLALEAAPAVLSAAQAEGLLSTLLQSSEAAERGPADLKASLLEALAASQSCRSAIKMHHPLSPEEMESLVAELFTAEQPYACPHGRPIILKMTDADLEKRFGRT